LISIIQLAIKMVLGLCICSCEEGEKTDILAIKILVVDDQEKAILPKAYYLI